MTSPSAVTATGSSPVALDGERLDVYRVAVEAQVTAATLIPAEHRVLRDQLERASVSVVLNISEGAGRRSRKDKRRHYAIARGSAMECAAALDLVNARHMAPEAEARRVRHLYVPRDSDAHQAGYRALLKTRTAVSGFAHGRSPGHVHVHGWRARLRPRRKN
jgi:four helix bundle protein